MPKFDQISPIFRGLRENCCDIRAQFGHRAGKHFTQTQMQITLWPLAQKRMSKTKRRCANGDVGQRIAEKGSQKRGITERDIDNVRYSFETQEFFQRQLEESVNSLINKNNVETDKVFTWFMS